MGEGEEGGKEVRISLHSVMYGNILLGSGGPAIGT